MNNEHQIFGDENQVPLKFEHLETHGNDKTHEDFFENEHIPEVENEGEN